MPVNSSGTGGGQDRGTISAQHLRLPLSVGPAARFSTVEQDSGEDLRQSVAVLVSTRPGERLSVPGYGVADPRFRPAADLEDYAGELVEAVRTWDPRTVDVTVDVTFPAGTPDSAVLTIGGTA